MNKIIELEINDNETGYKRVHDYIFKYWKHNSFEDVIVSLGLSYDGHHYRMTNEIALPYGDCDVEYLYDWWEGEKYIKIFGIKGVEKIDIHGGIYEE